MNLTDSGLSPFERDIADQADALRAYAHSAPPPERTTLASGQYDRVILTGMGSSHFAAVICAGRPAAIIGITNDPASPLAGQADIFIPLHSGCEATVSTKSYLNTLAALERLAALLTGAPAEDVWDTIKTVEAFSCPAALAGIAADFTSDHDARLAFVGFAEQAATALYAGLITKEAAKVPAEGYIGGQFRHGPLELAGPASPPSSSPATPPPGTRCGSWGTTSSLLAPRSSP
jgi:glucosamine--fructose-6-phosphate aminotransferase (isomerizing)